MTKGDEMFRFLKSNKVFSIFLTIIVSFIGFLGFNSLRYKEGELPPGFVVETPTPEEPNEETPSSKPLEINSFTGSFSDSKNMIILKWKVTENDARIEKMELFHNSELLEVVTRKTSFECPLLMNGITTGDNEFTLKITSEEGQIIEKTTTVSVNYVFDVTKTTQFVDNNLGRGVLLSITYRSHQQTPVGLPELSMETTLTGYYQHRYLERVTTPLINGFEETTVYYFMTFDQTDQTNVTWNVKYDFVSVGVLEDDVIVRDISNISYETQEILLPSMQR